MACHHISTVKCSECAPISNINIAPWEDTIGTFVIGPRPGILPKQVPSTGGRRMAETLGNLGADLKKTRLAVLTISEVLKARFNNLATKELLELSFNVVEALSKEGVL